MGLKNGGETDTWSKNLSRSEIQAIQDYSENNYGFINASLRDGKTDSEYYKQGLKIEKALNKFDLKKNITVFRGDNGGLLPNGEGKTVDELLAIAQKGLEFKTKNFVSSSVTHPFEPRIAQYTIKVPKGKRGAYIKKLSSFRDENEFLINRKTKFRVVDAYAVTANRVNISLEIID